MLKRLLLRLCLVFALVSLAQVSTAQCPMCKISAETNLNNGGSAGQGLNKGILYLFATPYLIIGGIGFFWYRNRKRRLEEDDLLPGEAQLN